MRYHLAGSLPLHHLASRDANHRQYTRLPAALEFASMTPVAGSAYTYTYTTLGELCAWIIGWDLILEYADPFPR